MKRIIIAILAAILVASAQTQDEAERLFKVAQNAEVVDGDLKAAIQQYTAIVSEYPGERAIAARALIRMAGCHEKLGTSEAGKIYEQVVSEYSNQREQVITAQAKLAAMGAESQLSAGATVRKIDFVAQRDVYEALPWNVSADGRYLGASDYFTLNAAVVDLVAGKYWNVTDYDGSAFAGRAAISRNGKRLAFWHHRGDIDGNLRVAGADGTGERVLLKADDFNRGHGVPEDWSPDEKYVAVRLYGQSPTAAAERDGVDFALVPVDGGEVRVLRTLEAAGSKGKLIFSPDGRYLAYDSPPRVGTRQTDLYILAVSDGRETAIAPHPAGETFVGWTPNGEILFLSDRTGAIGLYRVAVENGRQSGEPQLLKDDVGDIKPLGVTAAGSFYYSDTQPIRNSYFASIDFSTGKLLSKPERVTGRFEDSVSMPSWSQDGQYFSYLRHRSGGAAPSVVIREVSSGKERELLPAVALQERGAKLRWLPDGKSLLAIGAKDDQTGLFRISIDTGAATLVHEVEWLQYYSSGDWDPDANWFFYPGGENRRSILRRNLQTGEERAIYSGEFRLRNHRVSPDGSLIAFVRRAGEGIPNKLGVVSTDAGSFREIFSQQPESDRFCFSSLGTAWSKDSRYILFVRDQPRDGKSGGIGEISFDPNSDRFTFSTESSKTEYWVMENFLPTVSASK